MKKGSFYWLPFLYFSVRLKTICIRYVLGLIKNRMIPVNTQSWQVHLDPVSPPTPIIYAVGSRNLDRFAVGRTVKPVFYFITVIYSVVVIYQMILISSF